MRKIKAHILRTNYGIRWDIVKELPFLTYVLHCFVALVHNQFDITQVSCDVCCFKIVYFISTMNRKLLGTGRNVNEIKKLGLEELKVNLQEQNIDQRNE